MTIGPSDTDRLAFREATPVDAAFLLELLNQESFIRGIDDRGIRTEDQARDYIRDRLVAGYRQNGFGMWIVVLKATGQPLGMSGLVARDGFDLPDLGYAFLDRFNGKGYAREAAGATLDFAEHVLGLQHILAIVSPDNERSVRLLKTIGFRYQRQAVLPANGNTIDIYSWKAD